MLDVAIGFAAVMLAVSLIVMSLTQAAASVLALRGAKLRRGLEDLIKHTMPDVAAQAKDIADRMIKHPLISDAATGLGKRWKLASTIKREELIPVLDAVLKESGIKTQGIAGIAAEQLEALNAWFDSFMSRVSQWFTMNTRWIALAFASAFALSTHLDSIQLVRQIHNDSETRVRLSAIAGMLLDQTNDATRGVEAAYQDALKEFVEGNKESFNEAVSSTAGRVSTRQEARDWIQQNLKDGAARTPLVAKFDTALDDRLAKTLDKSIDRAKTLESDLSLAGITFRPGPGHSYRDHLAAADWGHLGGIAASILFLSLGAPFWFNLLKNMTSLRSAVAQKDSEAPDTGRGRQVGSRVSAGPVAFGAGAGGGKDAHLPMLPARADQGATQTREPK
jgi:hypothetical protein